MSKLPSQKSDGQPSTSEQHQPKREFPTLHLPRIRTVRPDFFLDTDLFDAEQETSLPLRVAYVGLWCCCDREGRFEWNPRRLKTEIPYDDVDFSRVLHALATRGWVVQYARLTPQNESIYGCVPSFKKYQVVNPREKASVLPPPPIGSDYCDFDASPTRNDASGTRGLGEGEVEVEVEREKDVCTYARKKSEPLPENFAISESVQNWATQEGIDSELLEECFEHFTTWARAKGAQTADWDSLFKQAIDEDWAHQGKYAS